MPYILSLGVFGGMTYFKNPLQVMTPKALTS